MALSAQERALAKKLKAEGKSTQEIASAVGGSRAGISSNFEGSPLAPARGSRVIGAGKGFLEGAIGTSALLQSGGQRILAGIDPTKTLEEVQASTGFKSLQGDQLAEIMEMLKAKNSRERQGKVAGFIGEVALSGGTGLVRKGFQRGSSAISSRLPAVADTVKNAIPSRVASVADDTPRIVQGGIDQVKEIAERVPRFLGRVRESGETAIARSERIKSSPPAIQNAIKSNLDEKFIVGVQEADTPTLKGYREMVELANKNKDSIKLKPQDKPSIVAGRVIDDQYKLVETERKRVGSLIGEAVDELSKTTAKVPMKQSFAQLDEVLEGAGGVFNPKTGKWDFALKYTPKQRKLINDLYELATEGGEELTQRQIYDADKLFSTLQRESRFDAVSDIFVKTPDGDMNIFRVVRDIFTNTLDEVSDEGIRALNKEYRNIVTLLDDVENSIIKSGGKFEARQGMDGAEFASVNLKRIAGEAQSSTIYAEIANLLDDSARRLGYSGAKADDLIFFAEELKKLYPNTIPKGGFVGGIRTGVVDLAQNVLKAGAPDAGDQQKALQELLDFMIDLK